MLIEQRFSFGMIFNLQSHGSLTANKNQYIQVKLLMLNPTSFCQMLINLCSFEKGMVSLMAHGVGKEIGTAITGWLFTSKGTTITLCYLSITTVVFLVIWTVYIFAAKDLDGYMQLSTNDPDDEKE